MSYRSKPGISGTQLVQLDRSPAHYNYLVQNPIEPTPAMEFGTAAHTMVLETAFFNTRYAVFKGEGTRASKEYKEFAAYNKGKLILKQEDFDRITGMVTELERHGLARELLLHSTGKNEHELYWQEAGVTCKGKLDRYLDSNVVVDFKTAHDASPSSFNSYKARSMGYYLQAAHYQAGIRATTGSVSVPAFVFVVQETEAPFAIQVYELDQVSIDRAHERRLQLLEVYKACLDTGVWNGYNEEVIKL